MDCYIAHHGVKGMKWGVRKNTGLQRLFRGKRRFDYTTEKGTRISTRATKGDVRALKKRGYLDWRGNTNEGYEKSARNYLLRRNIGRLVVGAAATAVVVKKGKAYVDKRK